MSGSRLSKLIQAAAALLLCGAGISGQVVVTDVGTDSVAAHAGLLKGDLVRSWQKSTGQGELRSPFDVSLVEAEQGVGPVTLHGRHEERDARWIIPESPLGLTTRPVWDAKWTEEYRHGAELLAAGKSIDAADVWEKAGDETTGSSSAWLLLKAATAYAQAKRWDENGRSLAKALEKCGSDSAARIQIEAAWGAAAFQRRLWAQVKSHYDRASAEAAKLNAQITVSEMLFQIGRAYLEQRLAEQAVPYMQGALTIRERLLPDTQSLAHVLNGLGRSFLDEDQLPQAEALFLRSQKLIEKLAARSSLHAATLHNLGIVTMGQDKFAAAEDYFRRSMEISSALAGGETLWANSASSLSVVKRRVGDFDAAAKYQQESLSIRRKLEPGGLPVASSLNNLANLDRMRGDLKKAEAEYRESLEINQKLVPNTRVVAGGLESLGNLAQQRGDLNLAADYYSQAIELWKKLSPNSVNWAETLTNLALVLQDQGHLQEAEKDYGEALAVFDWQKTSPLSAARLRRGLGQLHELQGRFRLADDEYVRGFAVLKTAVPGSVETAEMAFRIGDLARRQGDWERARTFYQQSLSLRENLLPNTTDLAESLHGMALVARHDKRAGEAETFFARSIAALESQAKSFGGSEVVDANFHSTYAAFYHDYIDLLVEKQKTREAFHVLEQSRAQAMLDLLAQRQLSFADAPGEFIAKLRTLAAEYDRVQERLLSTAATKNSAQTLALQSRLVEIEGERSSFIERIREQSPKYAQLEYPTSLDLSGAQAALEGGTVLLSYLVEPDRTLLFVVRPTNQAPGISLFTIPTKAADLRKKVRAFRIEIEKSTAYRRPELTEQAQALYGLLLKPAEALLRQSERVLLSPDGPLYKLPFDALIRGNQFLVEWKPLHSTLSATLYAELKKGSRAPANYPVTLAAFGSPNYSPAQGKSETQPADELRGLVGGWSLRQLPFSKAEVEQISALYPGRSKVFLGSDATEEHAKAIGADTRFIHFAVHGVIDEKMPLNSALILSMPQKEHTGDNGFLQSWELYQNVHWDAELVVLSACETALGPEMEGEGLMGLTRAIHYAGARSVLSSLWSVDDRRTQQLMIEFYRRLQAGEPKDAALRGAQLSLLHSRGAAAPFYWAAFTLDGDWK